MTEEQKKLTLEDMISQEREVQGRQKQTAKLPAIQQPNASQRLFETNKIQTRSAQALSRPRQQSTQGDGSHS